MEINKRKQAAKKAVNTLRLNLLAQTNRRKIKKLCEEIIAKEYEIDDDVSRQGIIAREIGKTSYQSFCRFGDRNNATKALILCWIDNKGLSLDEQAYWIYETYGIDILPSELAEFMMENDRGKSTYPPYAELQHLKTLFKEMTGFTFNIKFVRDNILINNEVRK